MKNIINFIIGYVIKTQEQAISFLCTQVSYRLLVAIFPFILVIFIFISRISADTLMQLLSNQDAISEMVTGIFMRYLNAITDSESLSFSQFSIFSAINIFAVYYMLRCLIPLNHAFNSIMGVTENRSFVRVYTSSLIATLGMLAGITAVIVIVGMDILLHIPFIRSLQNFDIFVDFVDILSVFLPSAIYALVVTIIYLTLPAKRYSLRFNVTSILISTVVWSLGTWVFTLYINYTASNFHVVFGSLGTVISLFMWLNFFSQSILYSFSFTLYLFSERDLSLNIQDNRLLISIDHLINFLSNKIGFSL